jgi:hypothetical protein
VGMRAEEPIEEVEPSVLQHSSPSRPSKVQASPCRLTTEDHSSVRDFWLNVGAGVHWRRTVNRHELAQEEDDPP